MKYRIIPVTVYMQNATLLWCSQKMQGAIVDPGGEVDQLLDAVKEEGVVLQHILLTHGHIDHVGYAAELAERTNVPIIGPHHDDQFLLQSLDKYAQLTQLDHSGTFVPQRWLVDGDTVKVGNQMLDVLHCPGHTPGHVVYIDASNRLAIVGDVLFKNSIGRTDFPRGDHKTLIHSIKHKLLPLGDDMEFIPGHGENSTLGQERCENPFLV